MDITWEAPGRSARGLGGVDPEEIEVANQLRARPNEWARVAEYDVNPERQSQRASGIAAMIKVNKRAAFKEDDRGYFDATARTRNGKNILYVRFMPA